MKGSPTLAARILPPARTKRRARPAEPAEPAAPPEPAEPAAPAPAPPSLRGVLRRSAVRRALGDPALRMRAGFVEAFEAKVVEDLLRSVARAKAHRRSTLLPADV
jgi:hypothetical protein